MGRLTACAYPVLLDHAMSSFKKLLLVLANIACIAFSSIWVFGSTPNSAIENTAEMVAAEVHQMNDLRALRHRIVRQDRAYRVQEEVLMGYHSVFRYVCLAIMVSSAFSLVLLLWKQKKT